ncbi:MAG: LLM class flavin-dependent oxidoreductase, partial [Gammaproteobacteria bacterium]|nr:LLM class flavin-dependent oxidoreductase [Gammaproteobacteria bacterium]
DYVDFDPIWSYPKPIQEGGPPIWIGAQSKYTVARVAEYADGWMPIGGLRSAQLEELRRACDAQERKLEDITLALFGGWPDAEQIKGRIQQGFDVVIFNVPAAPADEVLPILDNYAEVLKQVKS